MQYYRKWNLYDPLTLTFNQILIKMCLMQNN